MSVRLFGVALGALLAHLFFGSEQRAASQPEPRDPCEHEFDDEEMIMDDMDPDNGFI